MEEDKHNDLNDFELQKMVEFRDRLEERVRISSKEKLNEGLLSEQIIRYLRYNNFDVEAALLNLLRLLRLRMADEMAQIPYKEYKRVYDAQIFLILKKRAADGTKILWIRQRNWNYEEIDIVTYFAGIFHYMDEALYSQETQKHGFSVVFDASGMGLITTTKMLSLLSLDIVTQFASFIQGAYPLKLKAVHCINFPFIMTSFYAGIKYLLSKKMRRRIHIHRKGVEVLQTYFDKKILPVELNGYIPDEDAQDTNLLKAVNKNGMVDAPDALTLKTYFTIPN